MASFYLKKNNAKTSLSFGITGSSTTLKVKDGSVFPATGNFVVTIWDKTPYPDPGDDASMEILLVTGISGNTITDNQLVGIYVNSSSSYTNISNNRVS